MSHSVRPFRALLGLVTTAGALLLTPLVQAERADRDKPINIEADRMTVDDRSKVQVFEGRVRLAQGTLVITANKVVVSQDAEGYQKGVATGGDGGLARFRQKREGRDDFIEGEGERIEYFSRTDKAQLFQRAYLKSGQDEVRGQYVEYDGYTEKYLVTNGPNASVVPSGERVRAVIQPRGSAASPPAAPKP